MNRLPDRPLSRDELVAAAHGSGMTLSERFLLEILDQLIHLNEFLRAKSL